jgi:hypothetical protein
VIGALAAWSTGSGAPVAQDAPAFERNEPVGPVRQKGNDQEQRLSSLRQATFMVRQARSIRRTAHRSGCLELAQTAVRTWRVTPGLY